MIKPESLRMRLHEMNRPPEYLQAYPAEEMDKYLDELQAENTRLMEALIKLADWIDGLICQCDPETGYICERCALARIASDAIEGRIK